MNKKRETERIVTIFVSRGRSDGHVVGHDLVCYRKLPPVKGRKSNILDIRHLHLIYEEEIQRVKMKLKTTEHI